MRSVEKRQSTVDTLFLLILFGVFLLSALFIVLFGAKIYQKTADDMTANFTERTTVSYVTEKIRQMDGFGQVSIKTMDGTQVLDLVTNVYGTDYHTYLYFDEGALREITGDSALPFQKENGTPVLSLVSFTMEEEAPSLLHFTATGKDAKTVSFYVSLQSSQKED